MTLGRRQIIMHRTPTHDRISFRLLAPVLATGALFVLASCGDDTSIPGNDQPSDSTGTIAPPVASVATTVPPTTTAPSGFDHPAGADDVVVEIVFEGGFVPADFAFRNLPSVLVSGDGLQYSQGPQIEIYPGPMLPNVLVSDIGEAGVQELLSLAAEHGLLAPREYGRNDLIADAADTVVRIYANGEMYEHRAYALGMGIAQVNAETGDRAELQAFVEAAASAIPTDGASFGAETFLVRATPITDTSGYNVEPTIEDWTVEAVDLADASDCVAVPASEVQELFARASQLTFFVDDDATYEVWVKPLLPGDSC